MAQNSPKMRQGILGDVGVYAELYPSIVPRLEAALMSTQPELRKRLAALRAAEDARLTRRRDKLNRDYGLTATESRLAMHLADGGSVAGYAELFNVSIGTVRSQLKAIFGKTGVNRQAALAALVPRI